MSDEPAVSAIEVLDSTPSTLRALLGPLPEAVASEPGPEGWSPADVVAHLISVQHADVERIRLIAEGDEPRVPNIDEGEALA
jgi:hypothetical protein